MDISVISRQDTTDFYFKENIFSQHNKIENNENILYWEASCDNTWWFYFYDYFVLHLNTSSSWWFSDGWMGAWSMGDTRGRVSGWPGLLLVSLCFSLSPLAFDVPSVAFKVGYGQSKAKVGINALWGSSLLAGHALAFLWLHQSGPDAWKDKGKSDADDIFLNV